MIRPICILFLLVTAFSCDDTAMLPKPKAQLSLQYSRPDYMEISSPVLINLKRIQELILNCLTIARAN